MSTHDRTWRGEGAPEDDAAGQPQADGVDPARLSAMQRRWLQRKAHEANEHDAVRAADNETAAAVSDPGDASEKEADAAADHVADELHGGGEATQGKKIARDKKPQITAAAPTVGRKIFRSPAKEGAPHQGEGKASKSEAVDDSDADSVLRAMDDILAGNGGRLIGDAPAKWQPQLRLLWKVNGGGVEGRRRRELFDQVARDLAPVLGHAPQSDYAGNVVENMSQLRASVLDSEATSRVQHTLIVDEGGKKEAIEIPEEGDVRGEGAVLGTTLPKLVDLIKTNLERAKTAGKLAGVGEDTVEKLETMGQVLTLAGGWLKLNDDEFRRELTHIKGVMHGVSTYSELVKTVLEMGSSAVSLTCTLSSALMRKVGDEAMAEACAHTGAAVSASVGTLVSAIEVVHGLSVMFDPKASRDARIDGGVEAAAGIAGLAGGAVMAAPIMGPYLMLKGAQRLYSDATLGFEVGFLREVFDYMGEQAAAIDGGSNAILAASQLQEAETDPDKRNALANVEKRAVAGLASTLDSFLGRCAATGADHGVGNEFIDRYPGNYTILAEAFTGPVQHRGAKSLDEVSALASMTMTKIAWCFQHGAAIVKASAMYKHVEDVQGIQDDMDEKAREKKKEEEG